MAGSGLTVAYMDATLTIEAPPAFCPAACSSRGRASWVSRKAAVTVSWYAASNCWGVAVSMVAESPW
ncbi:hypothetical protein D3C87_2022350 [compost metagenome]